MEGRVVIYRVTWHTFQPRRQSFSLKTFLIFSLKSFSYISGNISYTFRPQPSKLFPKKIIFFLKKTCSEKVSYIFSKKKKKNFQETELCYIFLKFFFLCFEKSIFRTLAYLKLEGYSEP